MPTLHVLDISYDSGRNRIRVEGFDEESRIFVNGFEADNPTGYSLRSDESALEVVTEIVQTLEGEVEQFYEVVSISETTGPNLTDLSGPRWQIWRVWYRNKKISK